MDRLENQWQDAYQRFTGAVGVVDFELDRGFIERLLRLLRPGRKAEMALLKQTARMEFNSCMKLCPEHPDLVGWASNPKLG